MRSIKEGTFWKPKESLHCKWQATFQPHPAGLGNGPRSVNVMASSLGEGAGGVLGFVLL